MKTEEESTEKERSLKTDRERNEDKPEKPWFYR